MKAEGRANTRTNEEYVNLYRYASTLKKEGKLDRDERAGVELSVVSSNTSDFGCLLVYGGHKCWGPFRNARRRYRVDLKKYIYYSCFSCEFDQFSG